MISFGPFGKELNRVEEVAQVEDQLPKEKPVPGCHADHRLNRVSLSRFHAFTPRCDPCHIRLGMAPASHPEPETVKTLKSAVQPTIQSIPTSTSVNFRRWIWHHDKPAYVVEIDGFRLPRLTATLPTATRQTTKLPSCPSCPNCSIQLPSKTLHPPPPCSSLSTPQIL